MANATRRGSVATTPFADYCTNRKAVSTAQKFYPNCMVGLLASGYLDKMDDAAVKRFDGVVAASQVEVLSGGADGDVTVVVNNPRYIAATIAAAVIGDIGRVVYASDDNTVSYSPGTYANRVGVVSQVLTATCVEVEVEYLGKGTGIGGGVTQVASANGAINVKEGTVLVTKTSAAALTLAAPTSGNDDGKRLVILSTTPFAHTVTQTTPGFNNLAGSGDVATYGAAAGNSLTVVAYGGVWYAVNVTGVTIA